MLPRASTRRESVVADRELHQVAERRDWDMVIANLEVYKYAGKEINEDPRRTKEYRDKVVSGLGFGPEAKRDDLTPADLAAMLQLGAIIGPFHGSGQGLHRS